jgi:hypothetical protein
VTWAEWIVDATLILACALVSGRLLYLIGYERGEKSAVVRRADIFLDRCKRRLDELDRTEKAYAKRWKIEDAEAEFVRLWEQANKSWNITDEALRGAKQAHRQHVADHEAALDAWRRLRDIRKDADA